MAKKIKNEKPHNPINAYNSEVDAAAAQLKEFLKNVPQDQHAEIIKNGLAAAVGFGFPQNQGLPGTEQISDVTTIFKNLRYYFISNFRQILSQAYVELGLIRTICGVPVEDALRGGVEIKSKQLEEDQIADLLVSLDRDDDLNTVGQAAIWNRLFGGAGILVLTDQDPRMPLNINAITKDENIEFRAVDMWELFWDKQNSEGYDPSLQQADFTHYNYYGQKIHKSRVMRLKGLTAPSFLRPRLRGWGFSEAESLVRSLNQYLKATDLGFEVLDEFKIDVYKIKNLTNTLLSPNGEQKVRDRVRIANFTKNYQNAIVMDSEDDYDHKQLSFAGLSDTMAGIRMQVASDMRMPLVKLFGEGASGFSSGEDVIEVYNSMVESTVRNKIKYPILRILEIKCQKLFGFVPDDLSVSFKPLRVLSAEQEETVKTQKMTRLSTALTAGAITAEEFRDACNRGNLFDITLEDDVDLTGYDADIVSDEGGTDKDVDDPGADRADTKKPTAKGSAKQDGNETVDMDTLANADWEESKHPRADDGKFGKGSGSGKSDKSDTKSGDDSKKKESAKRKEPKDVIKKASFSHQQKVALTDYKRKNYTLINTFLRDPEKAKITTSDEVRPATESEKKQAEQDIKQMDKAFSKSSLEEDVTVFRGMQSKALCENPESYVGKDLLDAGYMSTTTNPKYSSFHTGFESNRVEFKIIAKKGTPAIDMEQMEDAYQGESEILFPRNSTLRIVKASRENDKVVFEAELVTDSKKENELPEILIHQNSPQFDKASYEADGGAAWIDPRRKVLFENPKDVGLWARAKEASLAALGGESWEFQLWWYLKQGGKFH